MKRILILLSIAMLASCAFAQDFDKGLVPQVNVVDVLDQTCDFSFAIMSDNHGFAPANSPQMTRMAEWIKQSDCKFVVGMGDHLCKAFENPFLDFIRDDDFWADHFYPGISDGDNEFYGTGQGDWGAGGALLDHMDLAARPGVVIRENGAEYYAKIPVGEFTVHLIQLHYPDAPRDPKLAFTEDTRQFLIDTLNSIDKGPNDIVIACAHTFLGVWVPLLSEERREIVMDKCDICVSATTHVYLRQKLPGYESTGALCINDGSACRSRLPGDSGFVLVHVFRGQNDQPARMVVQYINTDLPDRRPALARNKAFVKEIGGDIYELNLWPDGTPPQVTEQ